MDDRVCGAAEAGGANERRTRESDTAWRDAGEGETGGRRAGGCSGPEPGTRELVREKRVEREREEKERTGE